MPASLRGFKMRRPFPVPSGRYSLSKYTRQREIMEHFSAVMLRCTWGLPSFKGRVAWDDFFWLIQSLQENAPNERACVLLLQPTLHLLFLGYYRRQRGLMYTEHKPLGRLYKMCYPFFHESHSVSKWITARLLYCMLLYSPQRLYAVCMIGFLLTYLSWKKGAVCHDFFSEGSIKELAGWAEAA